MAGGWRVRRLGQQEGKGPEDQSTLPFAGLAPRGCGTSLRRAGLMESGFGVQEERDGSRSALFDLGDHVLPPPPHSDVLPPGKVHLFPLTAKLLGEAIQGFHCLPAPFSSDNCHLSPAPLHQSSGSSQSPPSQVSP